MLRAARTAPSTYIAELSRSAKIMKTLAIRILKILSLVVPCFLLVGCAPKLSGRYDLQLSPTQGKQFSSYIEFDQSVARYSENGIIIEKDYEIRDGKVELTSANANPKVVFQLVINEDGSLSCGPLVWRKINLQ